MQTFERNNMNNCNLKKEIVRKCFSACWGKNGNVTSLELFYDSKVKINAPLQGSLNGVEQLQGFIRGVRLAFPDMDFELVLPLISEDDYVVGYWKGGGTHSGIAMPDFVGGPLPAATNKKVYFSGITIWKFKDNKIIEEITEEGAWTMFEQLDLVKKL
ncbi:ester cyclase [Pigmentibacter sp. JX0631]|uniref:ester cyclase n=1 Tax=Pigmentibacter sp. JX0631 TaxID=2976982 RepID=UPI002469B038|nr:ester cyclase [Pigmentibacter sp. JX0631]WGL59806.1 ester cyclase [Pigmentibacter sp. JX0631]